MLWEHATEFAASAVAAVLGLVGAIYARKAHREARDVNDAVNHRHENNAPRIFDMVLEVRGCVKELVEWKKGYDGGPLDTGRKVDNFVDEVREKLSELEGRCDECPHTKNCDQSSF